MKTNSKKCNTQKQLSKKKTKISKKNINNLSKLSKTQLGGILNIIDKTKIKYLIECGKKNIENNREYLYNLLINDKLFEIINIEYSDKQIEHIFNLFVNNNYEEAIEYFDKNYIDKINKYFDSVEDPIIKTVFPNNDELQTYIKTINLDSKLAIKLLWLSIIYHFAFQSEIFDKDMNDDTDQIKVNSYKEELDLQKSSTNTYSEIAKPILVNGGGFTSIRKSVKHNNKYSYKKYIGGRPPGRAPFIDMNGINRNINSFLRNVNTQNLIQFYELCRDKPSANMDERTFLNLYLPNEYYLDLIKKINRSQDNRFLNVETLINQNLALQNQKKAIDIQQLQYIEGLQYHQRVFTRMGRRLFSLKRFICVAAISVLLACYNPYGKHPYEIEQHRQYKSGIVNTGFPLTYCLATAAEMNNEYNRDPPDPPKISSDQADNQIQANLRLLLNSFIEIRKYIETHIRHTIERFILDIIEPSQKKLNDNRVRVLNEFPFLHTFLGKQKNNFIAELWETDFDLTNLMSDELNTIITNIGMPHTLGNFRNIYETVEKNCEVLKNQSELLDIEPELQQMNFLESDLIDNLNSLSINMLSDYGNILPIIQSLNDRFQTKHYKITSSDDKMNSFKTRYTKLNCKKLDDILRVYIEFETNIFTKNNPRYFDNKLIYITKLSYKNMELVRQTFYDQAKTVGISDPNQVNNLLDHCVNPDLYKEIISIRQHDADRISSEYRRYINLYIIFNNLENYQNNIRSFILVKIQDFFQAVLQTPDTQRRMRENLEFNGHPDRDTRLREHFDLQRRNVVRTHEEVLGLVNSWCSSLKADQRIGHRPDIDIIVNHLLLQPEFIHYQSRTRKLLEIHNNNYFIVKRQLTEEIKLKNINRLSDEFLNEIVTKCNNNIDKVIARIDNQNTLMEKSLVTREAAEQLLVESSGNLNQALIRIHRLGLLADPQTPHVANAANAQFQAANLRVIDFLND
jgi:hypothetical protein